MALAFFSTILTATILAGMAKEAGRTSTVQGTPLANQASGSFSASGVTSTREPYLSFKYEVPEGSQVICLKQLDNFWDQPLGLEACVHSPYIGRT